ncbi:CoA-binding protein [Egicoccus sp. AB-alg2]|uniref:CoA-binding protein n=1 Tax=Egicoccus sp. AB-alg2 TaxID=3242693 RepID=UPI00359D9DBC
MSLADDQIDDLLRRIRRIAVVGASDDLFRPSHGVMRRLLEAGYEVVPVNPNHVEVLGIPTVARLADVDGRIDLVDVFRRVEHTPQVAREAAAVGAGALWLQSGLRSADARRIATDAGLSYVEDRCLAVEVAVRGITAPAAAND